jgi:hypothetical protein
MAAVTPTMGVAFLRRTSTGGASENTTVAGLSAPCWVRIVRAGNNFSAYRSADGSAWTQIGATVAISMSSTIYVGLPVTSHVAGTLCQATFDNVTITQPTVPNAPSALTATAVSASQINLSWTDNSSNETGFRIERKTGSGGSWSQIATVGANVTAYADTGLSAGTQYTYRVRAAGSGGDSGYSNEANATTQSGGGTPGGLLETFNAGSAVADQTTFESVFLVDTLSGNKWTHSGTAGVGGGGAIQAPGGQNASAVHRTATPSFAVGETRILSLDTYVTYRTSSEPTFGISWWAYIKDTLSAGNGGLTVELRYIPPASRTPSEPERFHLLANGTKIGAPALTSGTWLGWDIAWTKTAAGTFDVAVTLSDLGSAGTGTPTPIGTYTRQGVASSAMAAATQVYAGIQGRARDGTGVFRVDNFAVGAAATVALDETFNAGSAVTDQTTLESVFLIDTLSGNKWSYAGTGGTGGTGGLQAPGGQNASAVHRTAAPGFAVGETHILSLDTYVTYRTSSEPTFGISWWAYIKDTLSAGNGGLTVELRYIPPTSRTVAEPERFHLLANGTKIGAPAFTSGTWLGWDIAWTKTAAGTFNVAVTLSDLDAAGTGAPTPIGTYTRQGIASSAMAAATQVYAGIQGRARDGTGVFRVDNVKVMAQ